MLARPTAVDDDAFRLLFFSPQRGAIDPVRTESILHRDAPAVAKQWVRQQGVAHTEGVGRIAGAEHVGLLPRIYVPIRHDGVLLGYLWIIDADSDLPARFDPQIEAVAAELAPLLYRRRTLDLLDRDREHETVTALLGDDPSQREEAAQRLLGSAPFGAEAQISVVAVEVVVPSDEVFDEAERLAFEATLEHSRSRIADAAAIHVTQATRAAVVIAVRRRHPGDDLPTTFAAELSDRCRQVLASRRIVVGVGSPTTQLVDAYRSHREAIAVTRILRAVPVLGDVRSYAQLGVYGVIAALPDDRLNPDLVPMAVNHLLDADFDGQLTATLEAFLDAAGDVPAVAATLGVHRSTVYGRLRRIASITNCSLDDGQDRLTLHVGLALARTVGRWR